eukprot:301980_1
MDTSSGTIIFGVNNGSAIFPAQEIGTSVTITMTFDFDCPVDVYCPGCIRQIMLGYDGTQMDCFTTGSGTKTYGNTLQFNYISDGLPKVIMTGMDLNLGCAEVVNNSVNTPIGYVAKGFTYSPTAIPTSNPTIQPTTYPTAIPTKYPTTIPTLYPTLFPTLSPTLSPTASENVTVTIGLGSDESIQIPSRMWVVELNVNNNVNASELSCIIYNTYLGINSVTTIPAHTFYFDAMWIDWDSNYIKNYVRVGYGNKVGENILCSANYYNNSAGWKYQD